MLLKAPAKSTPPSHSALLSTAAVRPLDHEVTDHRRGLHQVVGLRDAADHPSGGNHNRPHGDEREKKGSSHSLGSMCRRGQCESQANRSFSAAVVNSNHSVWQQETGRVRRGAGWEQGTPTNTLDVLRNPPKLLHSYTAFTSLFETGDAETKPGKPA